MNEPTRINSVTWALEVPGEITAEKALTPLTSLDAAYRAAMDALGEGHRITGMNLDDASSEGWWYVVTDIDDLDGVGRTLEDALLMVARCASGNPPDLIESRSIAVDKLHAAGN